MSEAIPEVIAVYVRDKVKGDVEDLLDDPQGAFSGMGPQEICAYMQKLDQIARLVDLPLIRLLSTSGTDVEYARLMEIILKARAAA